MTAKDSDRAAHDILKDLADTGNAVSKASTELESARSRERAAAMEATDCLNDLNRAQREFDALTDELRKATRGGDWSSKKVVLRAGVDVGVGHKHPTDACEGGVT